MKEKIQVTRNIFIALKRSLHGENLRQAIKRQGKSLSKLSEQCNLNPRSIDYSYMNQKRKYAFQDKMYWKRTNKLREFLQGNVLWDISEQYECLCLNLEIWKFTGGRDKDGVGRGVEMSGQPDVNFIFPKQNILHFCIEKKWVQKIVKTDDMGAEHTLYYLTKTGSALPKIKTRLKLKDLSSVFRPDGFES